MSRSSVKIATGASQVRDLSKLEEELKQLIVEALMLEDVAPTDIDSGAPLFGEAEGRGLGLDSIDVLELAMALNKRYGVKTQADDDRNREIFASVRNLAEFVDDQRAGGERV